jgi:ATP-dependent helicase HrpA
MTENMPKPTAADDINKLYSLLHESLPADRHFLRREINRLKRGTESGARPKNFRKKLLSLENKIRESGRRKKWRKENQPRFDLDTALPITARKEDIIEAIEQHSVVVISGETGSGKTTQIPKLCLAAGRGVDGKIGCTQPRRIAATSVAHRIAHELGEKLGRSVGYKIRFKDRTNPNAFIKVMTDGILLAEAQKDSFLNEYDTIIVDEAHERSLNIDFVLGILKSLQRKRRDLKVIITSATIDTEKFSKAFNGAPIIEVSGRMYPVQVEYADDESNLSPASNESNSDATYVEKAVAAVRQISGRKSRGDILVFMPTEQDIRETCDLLTAAQNIDGIVMPLFARLSAVEQRKIFSPVQGRKIIVATNVAETSLTIPGIRYVVDTGLARIPRYSPRSRTTTLPVVPVSISSADQRKGRCGRVEHGVCIRLFSEEDLNARAVFTPPEIIRSNLAEVILRMLALRLGNIADFPFIDPPSPKSIQDGYALLTELGAIAQSAERKAPGAGKRKQNQKSDIRSYRLTPKGRLMARLPIDPRLSRMLLAAQEFGCLKEMTIIAAALSIQDPRERPAEAAQDADRIHLQYVDPASDFLTLLNIWNRYREIRRQKRSNNQVKKFCKSNYLSYRRMREWQDINAQIVEILKENRINDDGKHRTISPEVRYAAIHKSILSGFLSNIAVKKEKNIFQAARGRQVMIFPGSATFNKAGNWVVAAEMVETSRLFARTTANIDAGWLEEIGRELCRSTYNSPRWSRRRGEVVASEQVTLFGLTIVSQRTVSFGPINPQEATETFIRQALVADDLQQSFGFMTHNRNIIDEVMNMEDRIRRRDIFVGEEALYRFYSRKLDRVWDVRTLARLLKRKRSDTFLRLKKQDVMRYNPEEEELASFPEQVQLGGGRFECDYCYDPSTTVDGLTVKVPSVSAELVPEASVEWLVPGMLEAKISALIKSLPKKYRKKLLPLADTAVRIAREMPKSDRALVACLSDYIYRQYGIDIPASAWNVAALEDHLFMRIAITDPTGTVIRSSRDSSILRLDNNGGSHLRELTDARMKWEKTGITRWDMGDIPDTIDLEIEDGTSWSVFPALSVVRHDIRAVDLRLFEQRTKAAESHKKGVCRLYCNHFHQDIRFLKKSLLLPEAMQKSADYFGGYQQFEKGLVDCVLNHLFQINIRSENEFYAYAEAIASEIIPTGRRLIEAVSPVLERYMNTRKVIFNFESSDRTTEALRVFFSGLKEDLARLVPENFYSLYNPDRLGHLPRYIKALAVRAERASVDFEKDREKSAAVERFAQSLESMLESLGPTASNEKRKTIEEFFWLLEEFKVSLFAQELGTDGPVSAKRLERKVAEITRMV